MRVKTEQPTRAAKKRAKKHMKRDMELVRETLLAVEASHSTDRPIDLQLPGRNPKLVSYNVRLLSEAGLLRAIEFSPLSGAVWAPQSLTWAGHEFLDAARNDTVWNRALATVKDSAVSVPFEVLKGLLLAGAKDLFGLK